MPKPRNCSTVDIMREKRLLFSSYTLNFYITVVITRNITMSDNSLIPVRMPIENLILKKKIYLFWIYHGYKMSQKMSSKYGH